MPKQTFLNLDKEKQNRIVECAFDEFAARDYDNAKLSNIIKSAKIPRGSLYQYFEDKADLYLYLIEISSNKKLEYLKEDLANPMELPFLKLFKKMYISGIQFAVDNPKMVQMFTLLLLKKGEIYNKIFKGNLDMAIDLYKTMIDRDKELGRIKKDIDSEVFAKLVIDMTTNISVNEITDEHSEFDYNGMYEKLSQILKIIEHGVMEEE